MEEFEYTNPTPAHFTLNGLKKGATADFSLYQGKSYSLPADNAYIKGLIAQGHLVPAKKPATNKTSKTA